LFLYAVLLLGAVVGLVAGGRPRGLLLEKLRFVGLLPLWLVLAAVPQVLAMLGFADWPSGPMLVALRTAHAAVVHGLSALFLLLNLVPWKARAGTSDHPVRPSVDGVDRAAIALLLVGIAATGTAVLANGGAMPVSADILLRTDNPALQFGLLHGYYLDRTLIGPDTVLPWLARTIPLPLLPADPPYVSPGELVTAVGLLALVLTLMRPYGRRTTGGPPISPRRFRSRRPRRGRRRA